MNNVYYIHNAYDARAIDASAIQDFQIPSMVLMERAALASYQIIKEKFNRKNRICIVCGPGNNGGDGMAIARILIEDGYNVSLFSVTENSMSKDEWNQYNILKKMNIKVIHSFDEILPHIQYADCIIDCLFGNGLSRNITGIYEKLIQEVNKSPAYVISIDIPSGLHATSGKILHCAIQANTTIALDCFKTGHFINDGPITCQEKICVHIGIPSVLHQHGDIYLNEAVATNCLPSRSNYGHKGTFKKALMIGGSQSMHGAITYSGMACFKSGVGTLTLMIPDCIGDIIAQKMECAMNIRVPSQNGVFDIQTLDMNNIIEPYQIISVGNGMGQNNSTKQIVKEVLQSNHTVVLDADAIWALKEQCDLLNRNASTILTPHIKEMSYICSKSVQEILEDPFTVLKEFTNQYKKCTVILKSSTTLIAQNGLIYVLDAPNSALAKGGSGDILCGIVTALCAQSEDYLKACACACYIHSQCAKKDIDPACYQPEDVIDEIPNVFKKLRVGM